MLTEPVSGAAQPPTGYVIPGPSLPSSELLSSPLKFSGKSARIRSVSDQKSHPGPR